MSNQIMITKSNQASSKIFIYNSSSTEPPCDEKISSAEPQNFCDVTIHTSAPFEIRIKNNNYKSGSGGENQQTTTAKSNGVAKKEEVEAAAKPIDESTKPFQVDEDVLMRTSDEKFYLGTIVQIATGASVKSEYLVQFDDNSTAWALEQNLKKLNTTDTTASDEPLCVACKQIDENDIVEVCNKCYRGYHRHCIKQQQVANFSSPWCCERCSEIIDISDSEDNETTTTMVEGEMKLALPYDLTSLKWDAQHKENKEQIYCYCGKQGIWKIHMMQCCKCLQWFHERCIESWKSAYHLLHGDTFFVFCCKICNDGEEFVRRLDFNFKTALHLVLYDFAMTRAQKSYSVAKEIAPFLMENWDRLNIPFEKLISREKLVRKILLTVKREDEFKMLGMSNKKKSDAVNLRRKCPPVSSIKLNLSNIDDVSDKTLKQLNIKAYHLKTDEELAVNKTDDIKPMAVVKRRDKTIKRSNSDASAEMIPDDSSDGTSICSTLDWIIPVPSSFKGKNNPFSRSYEPNVKMSEKSIMMGQKMFERPPEVRIVRTFKRRLSAKDLLAVGTNQEAKRRKTSMKRRKTDDVEIISEIIQPVTMPIPTYFPVRRESNEFARSSFSTASSNQMNEARNSARAAVAAADIAKASSSSLPMMAGTFSGIEPGEKITILAKRTTFDGKTHYLIDRSESKTSSD